MQIKKRKKAQSFTVSFRVSAMQLAELEARASRRNLSVHEQARILVLDALDSEGKEAEIAGLYNELEKLKFIFADATEALLVVGNYPKEKAKNWTTENIRQR
jgi:hypothetical protein